MDLTAFKKLIGDNPDLEKELIATFAQQSDENMAVLQKYRDVDGTHKFWVDAAHMMKGGAGNLGAEQLRRLCNEAQHFAGAADARTALYSKIECEYAGVIKYLKKSGLLTGQESL